MLIVLDNEMLYLMLTTFKSKILYSFWAYLG